MPAAELVFDAHQFVVAAVDQHNTRTRFCLEHGNEVFGVLVKVLLQIGELMGSDL